MFQLVPTRMVALAVATALGFAGALVATGPASATASTTAGAGAIAGAIADPGLNRCVENRIDVLHLGALLNALGLRAVLNLLGSLDCHTVATDIVDVSSLASVTGLATLNLDDNAILDLGSLAGLTSTTISATGQVVTLPSATAGSAVAIPFPTSRSGAVITPTVSGAVPGIIDPINRTVTWLGEGVGTLVWSTAGFTGTLVASVTTPGLARPTIAGTASVGGSLVASAEPGVSFQWMRGATVIAGAQAALYSPGIADIGAPLTVVVSKQGSRPGTSEATVAVVAGSIAVAPVPTVSGAASVGSLITAVPGAWSDRVTLAFQWKRAGHAIAGATASNFLITASDLGAVLTIVVTGSREGYNPRVRTSAGTSLVTAAPLVAPLPLATPTVIPSPLPTRTPATVTTTPQVVTTAPTSSAPGATDRSATTTTVAPGAAVTAPSKPVALAVVASRPAPTINGTARVGKTLTAVTSSWSPASKVGYRWKANGKVIAGATKKTLRLAARLAGKRITVSVTAKVGGSSTLTRTSAATKRVAR